MIDKELEFCQLISDDQVRITVSDPGPVCNVTGPEWPGIYAS